jgi:hypothetical protein
MFVAEMSSDSFQLLGMAERSLLPVFFMKRRGMEPAGRQLLSLRYAGAFDDDFSGDCLLDLVKRW